jgi:uncharacterized FlgJ-related protein
MRRNRQKELPGTRCSMLAIMLLIAIMVPACAREDVRIVETRGYADIVELFNEIGYTAEQWQAGIREVPRITITRIPRRWREKAPGIPVRDKKNIFFRLAGPGVLIENEKITAERERLLKTVQNGGALNDSWVLQLAKKYKVIKNDGDPLETDDLERLKKRVDIIPPSLALAQAAEESGWGTSRFAVEGNALFGQWDFSGSGIKPENQRDELGDYAIAQFDSPQQSVEAYILNLNTHRAYKKLRDKRAAMRKSSSKITGWELAKTLDKYSERGEDYVESLHSIMRVNQLIDTDDAYLWDKGTIIVSPVPRERFRQQ